MNAHIAHRRNDLAAIHIAKSQLRWDDDHYRDVLQTVCSVRSSADLDVTGRKRWLAHLQACLAAEGKPGRAKAPRKPLTAQQKLIWSLWFQLAEKKLVRERTGAALASFIKRQTDVDRLEWLTPQQEDLVIVSMKAWLKRGGSDGA